MRRYLTDREERERWKYYRTVPKKHYRQLSGRQDKVLNEQATAYGIPVGGPTIDLEAVLRWFHDYLSRTRIRGDSEADAIVQGASQELKDAYLREQIREKRERAKLARLERQQQEGSLLARDDVHRAHARIASLLRDCGSRLLREFGPVAQQMLDEAIDGAVREAVALCGGADGQPDR